MKKTKIFCCTLILFLQMCAPVIKTSPVIKGTDWNADIQGNNMQRFAGNQYVVINTSENDILEGTPLSSTDSITCMKGSNIFDCKELVNTNKGNNYDSKKDQ